MHQIQFWLTALPQTPLLDLRGPTSKAREEKGEAGKGKGGNGKEREGKRKEEGERRVGFCAPQFIFHISGSALKLVKLRI